MGSVGNINQNNNSLLNTQLKNIANTENTKKMPKSGTKVQQGFIEYVKKMTNIDLTPARDTYFDNKTGFNVDTRKLNPPNTLQLISYWIGKYTGGYEFSFHANGPYRTLIKVKRK